MNCKKCGQKINKNSKFCSKCGEKINSKKIKSESAKEECLFEGDKFYKNTILLFIIFPFLIFFSYYHLLYLFLLLGFIFLIIFTKKYNYTKKETKYKSALFLIFLFSFSYLLFFSDRPWHGDLNYDMYTLLKTIGGIIRVVTVFWFANKLNLKPYIKGLGIFSFVPLFGLTFLPVLLLVKQEKIVQKNKN